MGLAEEIEQLTGRLRSEIREATEAVTGAIGREVTENIGPILAGLRRHRPILQTKAFTLVTRDADVREVLGDHARFTVPYAAKMQAITGPFILGLDDTELYRRDHAALRAAFREQDLPGVGELALEGARWRIAAAGGQVDAVAGLADPVLDEVIAAYFGVPGPDTPTQVRWARSLFGDIFLNGGDRPDVHERALADAAEMRPHVDAVIDARRSALLRGDAPDDVLTRLLEAPDEEGGLHDLAIRHNMIGMIVGFIPTTSKAFAHVVEELLERPDELAGAQRAAAGGDRGLVAAYVFEALRFRPQTWALVRECAADTVIAAATDRATGVPAGATVIVATQSAMFDAEAVPEPDEFRLDRPPSAYLHFGHGLHTCFGEPINRVQLPALATALLEGPPLRRAGEPRTDGTYPVGLPVALGS